MTRLSLGSEEAEREEGEEEDGHAGKGHEKDLLQEANHL